MERTITIEIETKNMDVAIEKMNRIAELLQEVQQLIDSLSRKEKLET